MKKIIRFVATLLIVSLVMSLAACSSGGIVVSSGTPDPTLTAIPTPSPTATPNPTPTVEPTPTPTPQKVEAKAGIKKGQEKVEAEVNQRFEDFLNGTGEFTDEITKDRGFTPLFTDNKDLGCIASTEGNVFIVQGIILHYERTNEGEIIAFGTKDKKGKRIITLVEYPSQSFVKNEGRIKFSTYPDEDLYTGGSTPIYFVQRDSTYYSFFSSFVGKVSAISIYTSISSEDPNYSLMSDGMKKIWAESIDPKIDASSSFMTNVKFVDSGDGDFIKSSESARRFLDAEEGSIVTVSSYEEFDEFVKSGKIYGLPCCGGFRFIDD